MIYTEIKNGKKITKSDLGYSIHKVGTNEYFNFAIDGINDNFEYEEVIPEPIEDEETEPTEE